MMLCNVGELYILEHRTPTFEKSYILVTCINKIYKYYNYTIQKAFTI